MSKEQIPQEMPEFVKKTGDIQKITLQSPKLGTVECDTLVARPEIGGDTKTTYVVPGFTEGVVQDAKFAKSLADELNGEVIVLGQYSADERKLKSAHDAIEAQADILLEAIKQGGSTQTPLNFVTSSMGSIVFARAAAKATELGWTCFGEESEVVFISPAGTKLDEKKAKLLWRFVKQMKPSEHDNWDQEALDAGPNLVKQDPRKYLSEGLAVLKSSIDYEELGSLGISPHVITNPKDSLLGQDDLEDSIVMLLETGKLQSRSTPWTHPDIIGPDDTPNELTGHNAHMVNDLSAKRVAQAAARLLLDKE